MKIPSSRAGQVLVLFALVMLAVTLMALMTVSLGSKVKDRMELQTVADAAAYSNAVATARTYNTGSLLNRAMVSHWVAMAGVQSLHAWGTTTAAYLDVLGDLSYELQMPKPGGATCTDGRPYDPRWHTFDTCPEAWDDSADWEPCSNKTWQVRDAAYEFWHARYSLYRPPGGGPGPDDVSGRCKQGNCSAPRGRLNPGYGELDGDVAEQARAIRSAIHNLSALQLDTYENLRGALREQDLTERLLRQSHGMRADGPAPQGLSVGGSASSGPPRESWDEVSGAVTDDSSRTHSLAMTNAVMGSIGAKFPLTLEVRDGELRPPKQVDRFINQIQGYVNQSWPGRFTFRRSNEFSGCAFFSESTTLGQRQGGDDPMNTQRRLEALVAECKRPNGPRLGWGAAMGGAMGGVTVTYRNACTNAVERRSRKVVAAIRSTDSNHMALHAGSVDWGPGNGFVGGCHGNHAYYDTLDPHEHTLGPRIDNQSGIQPGGLGFVFPVTQREGAGGAEGQPKIPVLLKRQYGNGNPDPWDLLVRLRFSRNERRPATLDMTPALEGRMPQAAMSHGMTYYHRRGYWDEPANLLNPFWHATLVRSDIDSSRTPANDHTADILEEAGLDSASGVYQRLQRGENARSWQ